MMSSRDRWACAHLLGRVENIGGMKESGEADLDPLFLPISANERA